MKSSVARRETTTGGRDATTKQIPPKLALAVGMPSAPAPKGWRWSPLLALARLESGHTPSRRHPEYWGGEIPWIGIRDAKLNHGRRIDDTEQKTNQLGIENSAARVLPAETVCLSRTASVGYVVVMGRPMATSQDFVNWVCSENLDPDFLKYLFIAEGKEILRFASGSVHQTIYFPEAKAFHICAPQRAEQRRIVSILDAAFDAIASAKAHTKKNLRNARALFESNLNAVFTRCGDGWVDKRLDEVVADDCSLSYGIVQPGDDQPNGLPIVRPTDFSQTLVGLDGLKRINPQIAKGYQRTKLHGGELLLCVRGATGGVAIASQDLAGANVTRGIVPIRFDSTAVNPRFGFYSFLASPVQEQIREKTTGTALMQINIRDLRSVRIQFPSLNKQHGITSQLDCFLTESERLEIIYQRKLTALDELKKSLLHQAFSGQL